MNVLLSDWNVFKAFATLLYHFQKKINLSKNQNDVVDVVLKPTLNTSTL